MSNVMRVAWLCPYPLNRLEKDGLKLEVPYTGHPGSWLVNLSEALAKRPDIELHIVTVAAQVSKDQCIDAGGVIYHVLRHGVPFTNRSWDGLSQWNARMSFRSIRKRLAIELKDIHPDVVHGHGTEEAYGLSAVESPFVSVVSIQGIITLYQESLPCLRYRLTAPTERACIKKGSSFMCRTHFDKGFVQKVNPQAQIFHVAEAINPLFFKSERRLPAPRILFVGGYGQRKGLRECLEAFSKVNDENTEVSLDVVGGGADKDFKEIEQRVQQLGLRDRVRFHGVLPSSEIAKLQEQSRVYVMTSKCENSPNVLAEALCSGTPCVAFDVGGISSMFKDEASGFLVRPGDTDAFAKRILKLLTDDLCWMSFSQKARMDSQVNRPDAVAEANMSVYNVIKKS